MIPFHWSSIYCTEKEYKRCYLFLVASQHLKDYLCFLLRDSKNNLKGMKHSHVAGPSKIHDINIDLWADQSGILPFERAENSSLSLSCRKFSRINSTRSWFISTLFCNIMAIYELINLFRLRFPLWIQHALAHAMTLKTPPLQKPFKERTEAVFAPSISTVICSPPTLVILLSTCPRAVQVVCLIEIMR